MVPQHLSEAKERYVAEGPKGLVYINAGGATALATFLSSRWEVTALREPILTGVGVLLFGVAVASSIYLARHYAFVIGHSRTPQFWYVLANRVMPPLALGAFLTGMGWVLRGLWLIDV